jgi:hypothetical protein
VRCPLLEGGALLLGIFVPIVRAGYARSWTKATGTTTNKTYFGAEGRLRQLLCGSRSVLMRS